MQMENLNLDKKSLRKFGITMGVFFLVIALVIFIRHKVSQVPVSIISATFFILAAVAPSLLKPVYIGWMKLGFILNWINTRLILFIIFYLLFTPMAVAIRLFKVDLLDRKIDRLKGSYWKKREKVPFSPLNYERQF